MKKLSLILMALICFLTTTNSSRAENIRAEEAAQSSWGYFLPLPFMKLSSATQRFYQNVEKLPLNAVGAVKVQDPPFRATAFYLGVFNRIHLFGVSAHVVVLNDRQKPYEVEFGHLTNQKFSVPVENVPLFATMNGDMAILRAKAGLSPEIEQRLRTITPAQLSFTPLSTLMSKHPNARFYTAGRGKFAHARSEQQNPDLQGLWTNKAIQMWLDSAAEAQNNLDDHTKQGDIFAFAQSDVLAGGMTQPLRDPDGLRIGDDTADPFMSAPVDWNPDAFPILGHIVGRMSGGPLFMTFNRFLGTPKTVVVGVGYTFGISENLTDPRNTILNEIRRRPARAFGEVNVVEKEVNGIKVPMLALMQTAPFTFMSSMAMAGKDLRTLLTDKRGPLTNDEREALRALADKAFQH